MIVSSISRRQLLAAAWASVQASRPAWAQFSTGVKVVNVLVTVRDREGQLVTDLTQENFELQENGRTQPIRYFSAQADAPLTIGLLFDLSGSQRTVIPDQRFAAQTFLNEMVRPQDRALIVGFNRVVAIEQALTGSLIELWDGLKRLEVPVQANGRLTEEAQGTAVFDAIHVASRILEPEAGRKVIVLISDGVDTASSMELKAVIESAQRADAQVYPIRFYDRQVFAFDVPGVAQDHLKRGLRNLRDIAERTGGAVFEVTDDDDVADLFQAIGEELRHQYSLGYAPPDGKPGYRKVRVRLKDVGSRKLTVQTREGYWAS